MLKDAIKSSSDTVSLLHDDSTMADLDLFSQEAFARVEARINIKDGKAFVECGIRLKPVALKREELVRQLWIDRLQHHYGYDLRRVSVEVPITFGRDTSKRADIVVYDAHKANAVYAIIEVKKANLREGKDQLKSYCHATGAPLAIWSNGSQQIVWNRKNPNYFTEIPDLPSSSQTIEEVVNEPWNIQTLIEKEEQRSKDGARVRSLKQIIEDLENEVLANAGVDVFEEVFKLIFVKLFDELSVARRLYPHLRFRNTNTANELKERLDKMFESAKDKWEGVFPKGDRLRLSAKHLQVCVGSLEEYKLFNSNLDIVDEAFEYLINKTSKGEKGQFFTPRWVIDMCVKMLRPTEEESMIDTAAGSSGFTVHTIFDVWKQIDSDEHRPESDNFTTDEKSARQVDYVKNKVFAIDFDEKAVRVARCLNLIAGDGETNVLHLNTLDFTRWNERVREQNWVDTYNDGWKRLRKLQLTANDYRHYNFDIVMANSPFAGDIKQTDILSIYDLGHKPNGKHENSVGRDLLFIERNLDFLRPGGRMAVVLPQSRFNNSSDKRVREFIAKKMSNSSGCRSKR